ncbi:Glycosyltransferase, catalytic subunit of cellulose synthase and poly-beta-1,6-N-acetylglucosamine synthase [Devosia enhydra]|uniref:Glycosyltransferase, catalytic subunit of cellulose synthase and poly-beta-1,6-N-acetylglucosamine synthase n=1 Tax=Devosia enhydra TaxID=665118 RepID=A0A1K2HTD9_9HYPH|nr:glycosyltransferase family 2 protein [Devosia enhydra]SFZ81467.1 Glycosyltransferase, catalytic subunit of cellulose synthase and poly-beta-1,6-N-acetylglucosamine synthase [Devosia enhydra]
MPRVVEKNGPIDSPDIVGFEPPAEPVVALHDAVTRLLIEKKQLALTDLAVALRRQHEWGSSLARTVIGLGFVRPMDYYRAVAEVYEVPFVNLQDDPVDATLTRVEERSDYAELNVLPWRRVNGRLMLATIEISPDLIRWADERFGAENYDFVVTSPFDILWQTSELFRQWDSYFAREALFAWKPEHSAKTTLSKSQKIAVAVMAGMLAMALILAPMGTAVVLMAVFTTIYTITFVFKFVLTFVGASRKADMEISPEAVKAVRDADLPIYTVLVPMFREAKVLPLLTRSLKGLDYPASKLEVKLVLEEEDTETIDAAKALRLPGTFEIIRVPKSQPKTKPKACNYALQFCRGEFVTIYDAEDQPEPDQLKKAVLAFRNSDEKLACVQGRLNYFNRGENWLTRMFTLEYSQWFDFLLPGLDWLKVPIPLGGTSNHFKLAVLRKVGAWDPYNVTEDADLGVRLAQEGYTVGVINSTTFEEANGVLPSWIKQRSRWIKGYMQTWLVHMRHPIQLWKSIGTKGFFAFHFFIGAPPFTMLLAPILWIITLLVWLTTTFEFGWLFPEPFGTMALFNLIIGNLFLVYFGVVAALKRKYYDLVPVGILLPVYWVLHSIAAYKAFWQLIVNPHYWEKTEHGTSSVTQKTLEEVKATLK